MRGRIGEAIVVGVVEGAVAIVATWAIPQMVEKSGAYPLAVEVPR